MQKKKKTAFSLVELSIVILIVSILVTGSLGVSKTAIGNSKTKITKDRMDTIYKALSNFVAINRRLPCPSVLNLAKGTAGYGAEAASPGTCTGITANGDTVYGMIPILALGLDPEIGEDGFGTKFSYVVDKRFTKQSASTSSSDGFEITKAVVAEDGTAISPTLIRVQGPSGTDIVPNLNALFVLISHGANKYGGWNATGTSQNSDGSIADETSNSFTSFDSTFIAYSTDANFDDILLFKTKPQLVRDAGLEFMICNASEATTSTKTWTTNGSYGCYVCSTTANNTKTCGKYGIWSTTSSVTCTANSIICSTMSTTQPDMVIYADQKASGTHGGTFTSGAWQTRTLNTTVYSKDSSSSFSLSSNQITLQPGTYQVEATATAYKVNGNQIRFYNITDGTADILGTGERSDGTVTTTTSSQLYGVITISSAKVFELQHKCLSTISTSGFGIAAVLGSNEQYALVKITKLL